MGNLGQELESKDQEIYEQEIERLKRQVEHRDSRINGFQRHIESLDRQIAQLIKTDTEKDDFILKIRKELIARL